MENDTEKLIEEQLGKLPVSLRKAIEVVPWKSSIKEIAVSNKLTLEQTETLERETMFILYGFENPQDYIGNMVRELGIGEEIATTIAEAVNEKVFKVIALKVDELNKPAQPLSVSKTPEIPPANLPMVEPASAQGSEPPARQGLASSGLDKPKMAPVPDYRYPGGKDPYREPLQ